MNKHQLEFIFHGFFFVAMCAIYNKETSPQYFGLIIMVWLGVFIASYFIARSNTHG